MRIMRDTIVTIKIPIKLLDNSFFFFHLDYVIFKTQKFIISRKKKLCAAIPDLITKFSILLILITVMIFLN